MLYFAVEDGNMDTTANVTLENGSVNQTILSGLRKYTQYSIQILYFFSIFCKNAVLNIRLYLKRFYASKGWKNHGNRLNLSS